MPPRELSRRAWLLVLLVATLVPAALYLPTLRYGFVFDDRPLLIENPVVRSPRSVAELFTTDLDPRARTSEAPTTNYLRPLFLVLAAGLHRLLGASPVGWHAAAVALHAVLGGLAFVLLRREGIGLASALAGSLLFSLHPAHAQSAAWVSGLQDLLFGVTSLVAYLAYRASVERERPAAYGWAVLALAYALALLAKEPAIGLLLFAGFEAVTGAPRDRETARRPWAEWIVLALVTAGYLAYRAEVLGGVAHRFPTAPPLPLALASVPIALVAYLRDLLVPVDLFLLHPARPARSWLAPEVLLSTAALVVLVVLAILAARRRRRIARPLLWAAAWIAPVLAIWAVNPEWMVMDRYLLLPSLALGWLLALLLPLEEGRRTLRVAIWGASIALFAALTLAAQRPFADEERFWETAIRADPGSSSAWTERSRLLAEKGDLAGAGEGLERAIELDPQAQLPRLRRALLALRRGEVAAGAAELAELVARNPGYLPAWRNLVVARARLGDLDGAMRTLDEALARFAADPVLWGHKAVLLRERGDRTGALAAIRRAIELDPDDAEARLREGLLLEEMGRLSSAP